MRLYVVKLLFSTHTHTHTHTHTTSTIEHRYVPTQFGLVYLSNMPRNRGFNLSDYRIRERQQDICLLMCNAVTEIQTEAMMVSFLRKNIVLSNAMIENLKIIHFCSEIGEDVSTSTWCFGVREYPTFIEYEYEHLEYRYRLPSKTAEEFFLTPSERRKEQYKEENSLIRKRRNTNSKRQGLFRE